MLFNRCVPIFFRLDMGNVIRDLRFGLCFFYSRYRLATHYPPTVRTTARSFTLVIFLLFLFLFLLQALTSHALHLGTFLIFSSLLPLVLSIVFLFLDFLSRFSPVAMISGSFLPHRRRRRFPRSGRVYTVSLLRSRQDCHVCLSAQFHFLCSCENRFCIEHYHCVQSLADCTLRYTSQAIFHRPMCMDCGTGYE